MLNKQKEQRTKYGIVKFVIIIQDSTKRNVEEVLKVLKTSQNIRKGWCTATRIRNTRFNVEGPLSERHEGPSSERRRDLALCVSAIHTAIHTQLGNTYTNLFPFPFVFQHLSTQHTTFIAQF